MGVGCERPVYNSWAGAYGAGISVDDGLRATTMGEWYEIDEATGCINYQSAATEWQVRSVMYTADQYKAALDMASRHHAEMDALLKSFVEGNDNAG
jgi:hypothetical protein